MGMSPSRTHRYVVSLTRAGFLEQDEQSGRYDIGLAAIEFGISAIARVDAIRVAADLMRELTDTTGFVSVLCVWGSNGPTVIKAELGRLETAVRIREGTNVSLITTAAGRIFLAYLPQDDTDAFVERDLAAWNAQATKATRMTRRDIERIRRDTREKGLAYAAGLRNPSVAALSAPVFGHNGDLVMGLTLIDVIESLTPDGVDAPREALTHAAQRLSRMLGKVG
jgi:DNA-binding IclR family transcriptional regulator